MTLQVAASALLATKLAGSMIIAGRLLAFGRFLLFAQLDMEEEARKRRSSWWQTTSFGDL